MEEQSLRKSGILATIVMGCTIISRLLGFIRMAVINAIFGASGNADVLNAVFNIPNNLRKLLAEGALSSAFIPVLSQQIVQEGSEKESVKIVRNIISIQVIIIVPLLILSVIFSESISGLFLDFAETERLKLGADLFRLLIHYLLLISISAVLMGVINSHNKFFIPAFTPILFSICVISAIILFHRRLGIFSMAIGVLAGGLAQILFQTPLFKKLGYDFKLDFNFSNPAFKKIMRQWLPVVGTSSIFTLNQIVAMRFATGLEDGSASAMNNALVFWQLPFGIFSASLTTVLFPRMSRQWALKDREGLKKTLFYGLRSLLVLLVPAAVLMIFFGNEIISIAFQRGEFVLENTLMAARVLRGFSYGLFSVGAYTFLQRFFYSCENYRIPLITAAITFAVDIVFSLWLKETYLRVTGLSIANSIAFSTGLIILFIYAVKLVRIKSIRSFGISFLKVALSMLPLTVFILLFQAISGPWWQEGSSMRGFIIIMIFGLAALGIVFIMYYLLRVEVFRDLLKRKLKEH